MNTQRAKYSNSIHAKIFLCPQADQKEKTMEDSPPTSTASPRLGNDDAGTQPGSQSANARLGSTRQLASTVPVKSLRSRERQESIKVGVQAFSPRELCSHDIVLDVALPL